MMTTPQPHHRYQSSLETRPALDDAERSRARTTFYHVVDHFKTQGATDEAKYDHVSLVRSTYEYARSPRSKDSFLRAFFDFMDLDIGGENHVNLQGEHEEAKLRCNLVNFATFLFENFFLPLKASARKTPQPTPASLFAIQRIHESIDNFAGTPERMSTLRGSCLIRDHHRCVITHKFDQLEAVNRLAKHGHGARDDQGQIFTTESQFSALEVAHILPRSLIKLDGDTDLSDAKKTALAILNMFDDGAAFLIEGVAIDRPRNALALTGDIHSFFSAFQVFFEHLPNEGDHVCKIDSFLPPLIFGGLLPLQRTLYLTETQTIEPPSQRLLAIHRAIAYILHLSGAGEYIEELLNDMEQTGVRSDGSTTIGLFTKLRMGGWLGATIS